MHFRLYLCFFSYAVGGPLLAQQAVTTLGGKTNFVPKFSGANTIINSSIVDTGERVGIGIPNPGWPLTVVKNSTLINTIDQVAEFNMIATPATASGGVYYTVAGVAQTPNTIGSQLANGELSGGLFDTDHFGLGTLGSAYGVSGDVVNRSTGTITNAYAGHLQVANAGHGTIANGYGLRISGAVNTGGGVFNNFYGLYLENATGATHNFAIYSVGGTNFFGGKVGINTTTPVSPLTVDGIIQSTSGGFKFPDGTVLATAGVTFPTGVNNTAVGVGALKLGTSASAGNSAFGSQALHANINGIGNTAVGTNALASNTSGELNTAVGDGVLISNTTADSNTGLGALALNVNTIGGSNTAVGNLALALNSTGSRNTAVGALRGITQPPFNSTGNDNTSLGYNAGEGQNGSFNIAIGSGAGTSINDQSYNIDIGSAGAPTDAGIIRIGDPTTQLNAFIAGINSSTVVGSAVIVDPVTGQLGIASSSRRAKKEIHDMAEATDALMKLRPVTFRYQKASSDALQYGLIGEEVEQLYPELVSHSEDGQVESVAYHQLPAMLLNEMQKQHKIIEEQSKLIDELARRVEAIEAAGGEMNLARRH